MIILISPSKTQDLSSAKVQSTTPVFLEDTRTLVRALRGYSADQLGELMKMSPKLAELNFGRFQNFAKKFDLETAGQALLSFKGDVYSGITADTYSEKDLAFAQGHLRILSGLYGILKPLDLIQPYRLEMGTKLPVGSTVNLYQFWGSRLTESINADLTESSSSVVVNLASNEYFKAIKPKELKGRVVTVAFKEKKGDAYKVVAIHAKRARGLMVEYIIKNRLVEVEGLHGFVDQGYRLNPAMSGENELVFCRS